MMAENNEKVLQFPVIRNTLDEVSITLTNLLDRQFPVKLRRHAGFQPYLFASILAARNICDAVRCMTADFPADPGRKPEFGIAAVPIVRALLDLLATLVFMREDLDERVAWFHRAGWRELKERYDRHEAAYGQQPSWAPWLRQFKQALEDLRQGWSITEAEALETKKLKRWPMCLPRTHLLPPFPYIRVFGNDMMRRATHLAVVLGMLALLAGPGLAGAATPARVHFSSLDEQATVLDGYLVRPDGDGRHPALVLLHGCGGLLTRTGTIESRQTDWTHRLAALGYVVLMVDSFGPRHQGEMCSQGGYRSAGYLARPKDAYGALQYLQDQPFVRGGRIGLLGWSEGGGALLLAIRTVSLGRPAGLASPDFRAAVAFYPASCHEGAHKVPWTSAIPLLVLVGAADNWTPAAPCAQFLAGARTRGAPVEWQIYPGAYHDFDWPNLSRRELEAYRRRSGEVPITGMDPAARADALERVPAFLGRYLLD